MSKVIIMRGIPGSGKSTWIAKNAPDAVVCSADHYFIQPDGSYVFMPEDLYLAHGACKTKFTQALMEKKPTVVVDNTNVRKRDVEWYVEEALSLGVDFADLYIVTLHVDPKVGAERNLHGVPPEVCQRMANTLATSDLGELNNFRVDETFKVPHE